MTPQSSAEVNGILIKEQRTHLRCLHRRIRLVGRHLSHLLADHALILNKEAAPISAKAIYRVPTVPTVIKMYQHFLRLGGVSDFLCLCDWKWCGSWMEPDLPISPGADAAVFGPVACWAVV